MKPLGRNLAAMAIGLGAAAAGLAQTTVYRCGPDGRSYAQTPCPEGRTLALADVRSHAQQAQARALLQREQARVLAQADERRGAQAAAATGAAGILDGRRIERAEAQKVAAREARELQQAQRKAGRKKGADRAQAKDPRVSFEIRLPKPAKAAKPPTRNATQTAKKPRR
jgi:hypothetical protein